MDTKESLINTNDQLVDDHIVGNLLFAPSPSGCVTGLAFSGGIDAALIFTGALSNLESPTSKIIALALPWIIYSVAGFGWLQHLDSPTHMGQGGESHAHYIGGPVSGIINFASEIKNRLQQK